MDDLVAFARLVDALAPWRGEIVIVGGWAHRLHRLDRRATVPPHAPLVTRDVDIGLSLAGRTRGSIRDALLSAGFVEELTGEHVPPVSHYSLGEEGGGFYAEFLAPLTGSGARHDGSSDATATRAGVTVQKLRHLDLLLTTPWTIRLAGSVGVPVAAPVDLLVANPVSFMGQKLLIRGERDSRKQAQDILYIHDTLELFGASLPALRSSWRDVLRGTLSRRHAEAVERVCVDAFAEVDDAIRRAARLPVDRRLDPESLRAACAYGLGEVFAR